MIIRFIELNIFGNYGSLMNFKLLILSLLLLTSLQADVGTLTKIVDGDALNFGSIKCRIEYIDTPESTNNRKNENDIKECTGVSTKDMKRLERVTKEHNIILWTVDKRLEFKKQ